MIESNDRAACDKERKVRYAVVGLGHIAQVAVLPAFANAEHASLAAIVSGDPVKRVELGKRYDVEHCIDYEGLDPLIEEGWVDAVYLALPNHLHEEYTVRAARAGAHVLCEKPMAVTERQCEKMIEACDRYGVKLMVAYRLHFAPAHLRMVELCQRGELGALRLFSSLFAQDVKPGDVRLAPLERGGGTVYDMGVYCINAARYLLRDEPVQVSAVSVRGRDERFSDCDEATSAILRFPDDRLCAFTSSFGAARTSHIRLVGTEGELRMDEAAYEYASEMSFELRKGERVTHEHFEESDQFAPELIYFSRCIVEETEPEPNGIEGLADVRIIEAVHRSAESGRAVDLPAIATPPSRPRPDQAMVCPPRSTPPEVHASGPSG